MRIKSIVLYALLSITPAAAQYQPKVQGELVEHSYYALDYNERHEQANWVYYRLTPGMSSGDTKRTNNFKEDLCVSSGSAKLSDYVGSGYDRGHLCPAGDMNFSKEAMKESFMMSNMSPQLPSFNRGIWRMCEIYVRELGCDTLYVVTGGVFRDCDKPIGESAVTVPGYYYKVAYHPGGERMWAFVIPNKGSSKSVEEFQTSVDHVEDITGIDFYHQLEDELEARLER
ncbi:MAG: DNA/RNA non-specific endonuclease [Rikenellaceae bacterium]